MFGVLCCAGVASAAAVEPCRVPEPEPEPDEALFLFALAAEAVEVARSSSCSPLSTSSIFSNRLSMVDAICESFAGSEVVCISLLSSWIWESREPGITSMVAVVLCWGEEEREHTE